MLSKTLIDADQVNRFDVSVDIKIDRNHIAPTLLAHLLADFDPKHPPIDRNVSAGLYGANAKHHSTKKNKI